MEMEVLLSAKTVQAVQDLYQQSITPDDVSLSLTNKDFEGDLTLVVFPFVRFAKSSPEQTGRDIGQYLLDHVEQVEAFNVVKGFLNLVIGDDHWRSVMHDNLGNEQYGRAAANGETVMVEYSSPNTNKPQHLGHIRNNLIGYSVAAMLEAAGYRVVRANLINDRGIHICKSMLAWQKWGEGETPESSGIKGDHLVGKYYVRFDQEYKKEVDRLIAGGMKAEEANSSAPLLMEAKEMLRQWEASDPKIRALWKKMNGWVYDGFNATYRRLGVSFDKMYYESDTYLLGKDIIEEGLKANVFFKKPDGSVWIDLSDEGLDEKLVLRSDGTSVYMTQDIGTAQLKYKDTAYHHSVYVVGSEQDYHFKVLKLILQKLKKPYADGIFHLSYGMVDLPSGKMKSREGTVVDADDLMDDMYETAKALTQELGKIGSFSPEEAEALYEMIGQAALKFYLLKVDPQRKMLFNPAESIDLHGFTGPFIQYAYARIQSLLKKYADLAEDPPQTKYTTLIPLEKEILILLSQYPKIVRESAGKYNPAEVAHYAYNLAKTFNKFYADCPILKSGDPAERYFRVRLSEFTGQVIKAAMSLLGIRVPDRM